MPRAEVGREVTAVGIPSDLVCGERGLKKNPKNLEPKSRSVYSQRKLNRWNFLVSFLCRKHRGQASCLAVKMLRELRQISPEGFERIGEIAKETVTLLPVGCRVLSLQFSTQERLP